MGKRKIITTEEFIEEAIKIHGSKYDYSKTTYTNLNNNVVITCREHGDFSQRASRHLNGSGCRRCISGKHLKLTLDNFISRATEAHKGKYDYSLVEYVHSRHKIKIVCPIHGVFIQAPHHHLEGRGCRKCRDSSMSNDRTKTTEQFIKEAKEVHGDKYDYSLADYKGATTNVKIICRTHGIFEQSPSNHLHGHNCPLCKVCGFNDNLIGRVYVLQSDNMYKIGITNREVSARVKNINKNLTCKFKSVFYREMEGLTARLVEKKVIDWLVCNGEVQPLEKFDGYTECFFNGRISLPTVIDKIIEFEKEILNGC